MKVKQIYKWCCKQDWVKPDTFLTVQEAHLGIFKGIYADEYVVDDLLRFLAEDYKMEISTLVQKISEDNS